MDKYLAVTICLVCGIGLMWCLGGHSKPSQTIQTPDVITQASPIVVESGMLEKVQRTPPTRDSIYSTCLSKTDNEDHKYCASWQEPFRYANEKKCDACTDACVGKNNARTCFDACDKQPACKEVPAYKSQDDCLAINCGERADNCSKPRQFNEPCREYVTSEQFAAITATEQDKALTALTRCVSNAKEDCQAGQRVQGYECGWLSNCNIRCGIKARSQCRAALASTYPSVNLFDLLGKHPEID